MYPPSPFHSASPSHRSLQQFKLSVAETVVSQDNTSLRSMNTSELLDLFQLRDSSAGGEGGERRKGGGGGGVRAMIEGLPELWSAEQYSAEYNLEGFMHSLAPSNT